MKYQIKQKTVNALEVDYILDKAKSDWVKLPTWFKKAHSKDKILIGFNLIQVDTKQYQQTACKDDVLLIDSNQDMFVMSKKDFYEAYEDIWAPAGGGSQIV